MKEVHAIQDKYSETRRINDFYQSDTEETINTEMVDERKHLSQQDNISLNMGQNALQTQRHVSTKFGKGLNQDKQDIMLQQMINRPKKVSTYPSKVSENHDDQKSMMAASVTSSLQITEYVRLKTGDRSGFGEHIGRPMTRSPELADSQRDNRSSIQENITPRTSFNKTAQVNFTFSKADNALQRDSMTRSSIETSLANAAVPANISHKRTTRNSQPRAMN